MTVRQTSKDAFHEIEANGRLNEQQRKLMTFFHSLPVGTALFRREIAEQSGLPINVACPRTLECITKGYLEELESVLDPVTGKRAHPVRVKQYQLKEAA
jgi:hypothetical protein